MQMQTVTDIGVLKDYRQRHVIIVNTWMYQDMAMIAYIFPQLKGSLLSILQLVNVGLQVTYCADFVTGVSTDNNTVFQGNRDIRTGLWMVDLRSLSTSNTNAPNSLQQQQYDWTL